MIKKLKLGFLVAVLALSVVASSANAAALTWSADYPVYLTTPGYTLTIKSGSEATSLVVGTSTITVVIPTSSVFTLASRNNVDLTLNSGTATTSNTCSGTTNTLVITSTSTANYTLTPNGGVCAASSGGGGGGGGGGGYTPPAAPYVAPATVATTVILGCNGTAGFSTATGQSCQFNTGGVTLGPANANANPSNSSYNSLTTGSYNLGTATLKNGSKGDAVKELQKVLNKILKTSLAIDGKLGPKTIATIKTWQKAHGLVADGLVGKLTKAAMVAEAAKN